MRSPNCLRTRLGQTEVQNLPLCDELFDRAGYILDGDFRIDAVLVIEVDAIGAEAHERLLNHSPDVLGPAVETTGLNVETELRRDANAIAKRGECFPDELFACVRPVNFGGIEKRDALFVGSANHMDALGSVGRRSVVGADAHAPGSQFRDFQRSEASSSEFPSVRRVRSFLGSAGVFAVPASGVAPEQGRDGESSADERGMRQEVAAADTVVIVDFFPALFHMHQR